MIPVDLIFRVRTAFESFNLLKSWMQGSKFQRISKFVKSEFRVNCSNNFKLTTSSKSGIYPSQCLLKLEDFYCPIDDGRIPKEILLFSRRGAEEKRSLFQILLTVTIERGDSGGCQVSKPREIIKRKGGRYRKEEEDEKKKKRMVSLNKRRRSSLSTRQQNGCWRISSVSLKFSKHFSAPFFYPRFQQSSSYSLVKSTHSINF